MERVRTIAREGLRTNPSCAARPRMLDPRKGEKISGKRVTTSMVSISLFAIRYSLFAIRY